MGHFVIAVWPVPRVDGLNTAYMEGGCEYIYLTRNRGQPTRWSSCLVFFVM